MKTFGIAARRTWPNRRDRVLATGFCAVLGFAAPAFAHHGFGRFDLDHEVTFSGTLTGIDFVNPHSYLHLDTVGPDGETISMRCEMRAATLLRRSGWMPEMFLIGSRVELQGFAHRDDPTSCYLENVTIGDAPEINRNQQFTSNASVAKPDRPPRLASGEPNISGEWAVEQRVLTVPPNGGRGDLVPKSLREAYATGRISLEEIRSREGARPNVVYTEAGRAAADAFRMWSPEDNPRLRCEPTSILFDWTFDWPVNRITQSEDEIVIDYGLYGFTRTIHMDTDEHPANVEPSYAGHSIARWEGDVLVVDTVGFEPGVIAPPIRHSDRLHIVERFSLDSDRAALTREYTAEDPVYFVEYSGSDVVFVADVPFETHPCKELAYEFITGEPDDE
jgi:hypothetical protein